MKEQPSTQWLHKGKNTKYLIQLECCEGKLSLSLAIHKRINGIWVYTERLYSIGCKVKSSKILTNRCRSNLKEKLRATIVYNYKQELI